MISIVAIGILLSATGCAPKLSIGDPSLSDANTGPVTYEVTYKRARAVTLASTHVSLNSTGTATGSVEVTGTGTDTRIVTLSDLTGDGTLGISIAAQTASNGNQNAKASDPSETFNVDNTPPALTIGSPSLSETNAGPVTFDVSYTEAASVTLATVDVSLDSPETAAGIVAVSGTGTDSRTVTLSDVSGDGPLGISLANDTATDAVGNQALATGSSDTLTVDNTPPGISIGPPSLTDTDFVPVTYDVIYTEAESITLASSDVTTIPTGDASGTVSVASGKDTETCSVTVSDIIGNGTLAISIGAETAVDSVGNAALETEPSTAFNVSNIGPTLTISSPSVSDTFTGPVTFEVTYNFADNITLAPGDVLFEGTGDVAGTVSVSGSGTETRIVTVSNITGDGRLGISIAPGSAIHNATNLAAGSAPSETFYAHAILAGGGGFEPGVATEPVLNGEVGPGDDAKAIARWDVVPYQTFDGIDETIGNLDDGVDDTIFRIGVVAFHINDIDRVEFSVDGGSFAAVTEMTLNPRTNVVEYWVGLDASLMEDGPIEVRAVAYPNVGIPRVLGGDTVEFGNGEHSMFLFTNGQQGFVRAQMYVGLNGSDDNEGTLNQPLATIARALDLVPDGGEIIILDQGTYIGPNRKQKIFNDRWITIKPADNLTVDDVIISRIEEFPDWTGIRPKVNLVHWQNISFDFGQIRSYTTRFCNTWFDQCKWFNPFGWASRGTRNVIVAGDNYVTGSSVTDMLHGFTHTILVRDCHMERISGDVLQKSKALFNNTVRTTDGSVLPIHTDLYQMWGETDNIILYGLEASDLFSTQSIFLQPTTRLPDPNAPQDAMTNSAFVNLQIENVPVFRGEEDRGGPPFSQMSAKFDHILFRDIELRNQVMLLRTDLLEGESNQFFNAKNVLFERVAFHAVSWSRYCDPASPDFQLVEGVRFENCSTSP